MNKILAVTLTTLLTGCSTPSLQEIIVSQQLQRHHVENEMIRTFVTIDGKKSVFRVPKVTYEIGITGAFVPDNSDFIQRYESLENPTLRKLAKKIVDEKDSIQEQFEDLCEFVTDNIRYTPDIQIAYSGLANNYDIRKTALQTLVDGKGDCDDIAKITYGLANSIGIPTYLVHLLPRFDQGPDGHMVVAREHTEKEIVEMVNNHNRETNPDTFTIVFLEDKHLVLYDPSFATTNYVYDDPGMYLYQIAHKEIFWNIEEFTEFTVSKSF